MKKIPSLKKILKFAKKERKEWDNFIQLIEKLLSTTNPDGKK